MVYNLRKKKNFEQKESVRKHSTQKLFSIWLPKIDPNQFVYNSYRIGTDEIRVSPYALLSIYSIHININKYQEKLAANS